MIYKRLRVVFITGLKLAIPVISRPVTKVLMSYVPSYVYIGSKSPKACHQKTTVKIFDDFTQILVLKKTHQAELFIHQVN